MTEDLVCDASVMVALLTSSVAAAAIAPRLSGHAIHVPAHFDAEVLSALGRLQRAGDIPPDEVARHLDVLARAPYERHPLGQLLGRAWHHRANVRLVDALYIALADELGAPIDHARQRAGRFCSARRAAPDPIRRVGGDGCDRVVSRRRAGRNLTWSGPPSGWQDLEGWGVATGRSGRSSRRSGCRCGRHGVARRERRWPHRRNRSATRRIGP